MTFLDTPVCGCCCCGSAASTTIGDIFKLIVPVGWSAVALMACLAYLISPLSRGDPPRWGSAGLVALSAVTGIGLSVAVYSFHRKTSSFGLEENYAEEETGREDDNNDGADESQSQPPPDIAAVTTTKVVTVLARQQQRARTLRIHAVVSLGFCLLSIVLAVFFGVFASDLDKCAHETCGADVSWSCITLTVSALWMGVTYLGYEDLRRMSLRNTIAGSDEEEKGLEIP
eukprot:jgi/Psemu1/194029/e_gw1.151.47.1